MPFRTVDEYIAAQPEASRPVLERLRAAIRKALPKAEEVISYSIPAYRVEGRVTLFFAGWKKHYSIYPFTAEMVEAFREDLTPPYEVNAKGTLRFPLTRPVPTALVGRIAKWRAKAVSKASA